MPNRHGAAVMPRSARAWMVAAATAVGAAASLPGSKR